MTNDWWSFYEKARFLLLKRSTVGIGTNSTVLPYHQTGVREVAEESVQEVFLTIWNRRSEVVIRHLDLYLTIAINNQVYDYIKSQVNYRKYQEYLIFQEIHQNYTTDEIVNYVELAEAVDKVLNLLPEKSAEVFKRSRFENQSVKENAHGLNLSEKAVEWAIVADLGFREVREVEPGDHVDLGGVDLVAVPTRHDNGRWAKGDAPICTGYVVTKDGLAVHHAGDVDFSDHAVFDDIGKQFTLDATLLPIGGMLPVWYYRWRRATIDRGVHIDPDCALDIFQRLGARTLLPVHWGTVNLRLGGAHGPRKRLEQIAAAGAVGGVRVLGHGEALPLRAP